MKDSALSAFLTRDMTTTLPWSWPGQSAGTSCTHFVCPSAFSNSVSAWAECILHIGKFWNRILHAALHFWAKHCEILSSLSQGAYLHLEWSGTAPLLVRHCGNTACFLKYLIDAGDSVAVHVFLCLIKLNANEIRVETCESVLVRSGMLQLVLMTTALSVPQSALQFSLCVQ